MQSNLNYRIESVVQSFSLIILTPHGGGIEPGTSELVRAIAGEKYSFFIYEGIRKSDNSELHIPSTEFNDPRLNKLLQSHQRALCIHGCKGANSQVYVGGLDSKFSLRIISCLNTANISAVMAEREDLNGTNPKNICNKTLLKKGVQLEITKGLRNKMFASLNRKGRQTTTKYFDRFVSATKAAIDHFIKN